MEHDVRNYDRHFYHPFCLVCLCLLSLKISAVLLEWMKNKRYSWQWRWRWLSSRMWLSVCSLLASRSVTQDCMLSNVCNGRDMERQNCCLIVGTVSAYGKTLFWRDCRHYFSVHLGELGKSSWKLRPRNELGSFRIQVRCVITWTNSLGM
jgi:hypothetical protein